MTYFVWKGRIWKIFIMEQLFQQSTTINSSTNNNNTNNANSNSVQLCNGLPHLVTAYKAEVFTCRRKLEERLRLIKMQLDVLLVENPSAHYPTQGSWKAAMHKLQPAMSSLQSMVDSFGATPNAADSEFIQSVIGIQQRLLPFLSDANCDTIVTAATDNPGESGAHDRPLVNATRFVHVDNRYQWYGSISLGACPFVPGDRIKFLHHSLYRRVYCADATVSELMPSGSSQLSVNFPGGSSQNISFLWPSSIYLHVLPFDQPSPLEQDYQSGELVLYYKCAQSQRFSFGRVVASAFLNGKPIPENKRCYVSDLLDSEERAYQMVNPEFIRRVPASTSRDVSKWTSELAKQQYHIAPVAVSRSNRLYSASVCSEFNSPSTSINGCSEWHPVYVRPPLIVYSLAQLMDQLRLAEMQLSALQRQFPDCWYPDQATFRATCESLCQFAIPLHTLRNCTAEVYPRSFHEEPSELYLRARRALHWLERFSSDINVATRVDTNYLEVAVDSDADRELASELLRTLAQAKIFVSIHRGGDQQFTSQHLAEIAECVSALRSLETRCATAKQLPGHLAERLSITQTVLASILATPQKTVIAEPLQAVDETALRPRVKLHRNFLQKKRYRAANGKTGFTIARAVHNAAVVRQQQSEVEPTTSVVSPAESETVEPAVQPTVIEQHARLDESFESSLTQLIAQLSLALLHHLYSGVKLSQPIIGLAAHTAEPPPSIPSISEPLACILAVPALSALFPRLRPYFIFDPGGYSTFSRGCFDSYRNHTSGSISNNSLCYRHCQFKCCLSRFRA